MNRLLLCALLFAVIPCRADTIFSLDPGPQPVSLGSQLTVNLDVTGLGGGTALATYELLVGFDDTLLAFDNVTFGTALDPDMLGNIQTVTPNTGSVDVFELSLDPSADLVASQPGAFTVATLVFDTLAAGANSPITLADVPTGMVTSIGDQDGNPIQASFVGASVTIVDTAPGVPEPSALVLLCSGLLAIFIRKATRC